MGWNDGSNDSEVLRRLGGDIQGLIMAVDALAKGMEPMVYRAAALQGLYAATADPNSCGLGAAEAAEHACAIADAMLAEVKKRKEGT